MDWQLDEEAGRFVGRVKGRVDETTWEAFAEVLIAAVRATAAAGSRALTIDLSGLDYMSSRGLRAISLAAKEAGEGVKISLGSPNKRMRDILAISRYDKLFEVVG